MTKQDLPNPDFLAWAAKQNLENGMFFSPYFERELSTSLPGEPNQGNMSACGILAIFMARSLDRKPISETSARHEDILKDSASGIEVVASLRAIRRPLPIVKDQPKVDLKSVVAEKPETLLKLENTILVCREESSHEEDIEFIQPALMFLAAKLITSKAKPGRFIMPFIHVVIGGGMHIATIQIILELKQPTTKKQ